MGYWYLRGGSVIGSRGMEDSAAVIAGRGMEDSVAGYC